MMRLLFISFLLLHAFVLHAGETVFTSMDEARKCPRKVHILDLRHQQLKELPSDLYRFRNLHTLLLDHNDIRIIDEQLSKCIKLRVLHFSDNLIERIPESLLRLKNLIAVHFDDNLIRYYPAALHQLSKLEILDIRYNICDSLPFDPAGFKSLKELYVDEAYFDSNKSMLIALAQNKLSLLYAGELMQWNRTCPSCIISQPANVFGLRSQCSKKYRESKRYFFIGLKEALRKAPRVRSLDLRMQGLEEIPATISQLIHLEEIYFGNSIRGTTNGKWNDQQIIDTLFYAENMISNLPDEFFKLSELQVLDATHLKKFSLDERIARIVELKELCLSHCGINSFPVQLNKLKNLRFLSVEHLRTADFDNKPVPDVFYDLKQLEVLMIGYNNWELDVNRFSAMTSLKKLSVAGIDLDDEKVKTLKKNLPLTSVEF